MIERIERLQQELVEIYDYNQGYLDRRAARKITTDVDTIKTCHQKTLAEVIDLLEVIKAEKIGEAEAEQQ